METHERVRQAIERWRGSEAQAWVAAWEGLDGDEAPAVVFPRVDPETFHAAAFGPDERAAATAHLARAAYERRAAPLRAELQASLPATVRLEGDLVPVSEAVLALLDASRSRPARRALEPIACRAASGALAVQRHGAAAAMEWLGAVEAQGHPDGGPPADDTRAAAHRLLELTDDAMRDLADRQGVERASDWLPVLHRGRDLFRPERRFQRIAADIEGLGLRGTLASHVHVASATPHPFRARLAVRRPEDIRLAGPALDGVLGEVFAAEGLGRALGLALVSGDLSPALRRPVAASVSRAFGALLAQVVADPIALRRRGLTRSETERAQRSAAAVILVVARLAAADVLVAGDALEARSAWVGRALGADVEPGSAVCLGSSAARPRFRGVLGGLALFAALRELHDEDWFRNPRAAEPLRGAATPGGRTSIEAVLGDLGAAPDLAFERLLEIVARA
ncbi:MAG: hypothetical protein CMN30_12085 [Sandaracinus sp.]|nr:hypothetical protein [Sandaracinus sp.]